MKKTLITAVYGAGTLTVAALVCVFLSHSQYVPFPNAMLPTTLYELATEWLALGTLPMLILSACVCKAYNTHGARTALVFLPPALCAASFLFWASVWVIALFRNGI